MATQTASSVQEQQLVVFRLGNEKYGIDIERVQGIERMQKVTVVPHAPHFVEGVINLRGQITPVMNLRTRFGFDKVEATKETRIVVVRMAEQWVGLVVDGVAGVQRLTSDHVEPPSDFVRSAESEYLRGIAKIEGGLLILLDLDKVLSGREATELAGAQAA